MAKAKSRAPVHSSAALAELSRAKNLQRRGLQAEDEITRLLEPLKDKLSALVLERDRLFHEAIAARQKFFQAVKKADPRLVHHRSLRYEGKGQNVYVVWDETGPQFSTHEGAELPILHPFVRRRRGRRALDLAFWLD